jgi:predicted nucleic acid-binding protein
VRAALAIEARWNTSWWDSVLLASAVATGCTHFLTEERQSAPVIEGVRIVDPLVTAPEAVLG